MFIASRHASNEFDTQIFVLSPVLLVLIIFVNELIYLLVCNFVPAESNHKTFGLLFVHKCLFFQNFIFLVIHFYCIL